jgi:hypothetical protein
LCRWPRLSRRGDLSCLRKGPVWLLRQRRNRRLIWGLLQRLT